MTIFDLGPLQRAPHSSLIRDIAAKCAVDPRIQAAWVGGSLAAGRGDAFSDIDFRIAVEPGHVNEWVDPEWQRFLPLAPCGALLLRFGERALLHHMVLSDGTIVDFYVQDTTQHNPEPSIVILFCRTADFQAALGSFVQPAASLVRAVDPAVVRQALVDYWITTHKEMKALARNYDYTAFTGLYFERMALLRVWYLHAAGKDIDARPTLHMVGLLHRGLAGTLTAEQHALLGLPSRTPQETARVIEAIRAEMARVGRMLAAQYQFAYPQELEDVVQRVWAEQRDELIKR